MRGDPRAWDRGWYKLHKPCENVPGSECRKRQPRNHSGWLALWWLPAMWTALFGVTPRQWSGSCKSVQTNGWKVKERDRRGTHLAVLLEGSGQRGGLSILLEPTCAWWWMEVALAGGARVGVGGRCSNSLVCSVTSLFCHGSLPEAGILTAFKCLLCACTVVIGLVLSLKGEGGRRGGSALVCLGGSSGAQRAEGLRNTPERRVPQLLPQSLALSWRVCRKRNKREAELGRAL